MTIPQLRAVIAILVVLFHVVFVIFSAVILRYHITSFATYISTLAIFMPLFGAFAGIVVQEVKLEVDRSKKKASKSFVYIIFMLLAAYFLGCSLVLGGYITGFIQDENSLPAAIAGVETAFGGLLMTCVVALFKVESRA